MDTDKLCSGGMIDLYVSFGTALTYYLVVCADATPCSKLYCNRELIRRHVGFTSELWQRRSACRQTKRLHDDIAYFSGHCFHPEDEIESKDCTYVGMGKNWTEFESTV